MLSTTNVFKKALVILALFTLTFGVMGVTPTQAAPANAPAGLDRAEWAQIKSLLPANQQAYLKASNPNAQDVFGDSVAISGDTVVVGAYNERSNATGVNGDETNNSLAQAGAAYVFIRSGTSWSQQAYLKASNTDALDAFGTSVAISGDTIVVAALKEGSNATGVNGDETNNLAPVSGAVYVFTRSGTTWSQQAYLKASNTKASDYFGTSIAISGDTVVVGDIGEDSNATGVNGDDANNLAGNSGAVYVFTRSGTTWSQQAYLKASNAEAGDALGRSVAISGDTVVATSYNEASDATGVNGNEFDNSAAGSGAAYVFTRTGTSWSQQAYLKASNAEASDAFGWSVAISGDTVVVGSIGEASDAPGVNGNEFDNSAARSGAAYVFTRSGTSWSQQAYLKASNTEADDLFGASLAISDDTIVVGAERESSNATGMNGNEADNSAIYSGAVYVFTRSGTNWSQQAYLKASNTEANDFFGASVAITGDTVVAAAHGEDSSATGVNGNQADNSVNNSGAVYIFAEAAPNTPTPTLTVPATQTETPTPSATKTFTRTPTKTPVALTLVSSAAQDGWVLESGENSNVGGSIDSAALTFSLGDDTAKRQYRGVLSFQTGAGIPDNATITAVTLKVKQQGIIGGGNPVSSLQGFMIDIQNGYFGTFAALQPLDFQATASGSYGPFVFSPVGNVYSINLTSGKSFINKLAVNSGLTQICLRFKLDDNNNTVANVLNLYSGNAVNAADRPQLVIVYTVP